MRRAAQVVAGALETAGKIVKPGITTEELDARIAEYIVERDCSVAFKGLYGFPANSCISVNEEVVHGIPDGRKLVEGDIVSIDVGAGYRNYFGDGARTFPVGEVSDEDARLIDVCRESLRKAFEAMGPGVALNKVSSAVQEHVEAAGFSIVRRYVGHGIGLKFHEDPQIPNYVDKNRKSPVILRPGMTLAVEPMINAGDYEVRTLDNEWTVVTADGSKSAHFEDTILITEDGAEILTRTDVGS